MSFVGIIQELNEFLKDLKGWESTVKEKEKKIQGQGPSKDSKKSVCSRGSLLNTTLYNDLALL